MQPRIPSRLILRVAVRLAAVCAMSPGSSAMAATIRVPQDVATIAAALAAAQDGDEVLVSAGTYAGFAARDLDFAGKAIRLRSASGAAATILDCQNAGRAFRFNQGVPATASVEGFTVRRGKPLPTGGAVSINAGAGPLFTDCVFREVDAVAGAQPLRGGAVFLAPNTSARFLRCRFEDCHIFSYTDGGGASGGGVFVGSGGSVELTDCDWSETRALRSTEHAITDLGGAVYVDTGGSLLLLDSRITGSGGISLSVGATAACTSSSWTNVERAVYSFGGSVHLIDCEVTECRYPEGPVGIQNSDLWISSSRIWGNQASTTSPYHEGGRGGAIRIKNGTLHLSSSIISGNSALERGGAIDTDNSQVELTNCTIAGNRVDVSTGGILALRNSPATITRSIVWGNCGQGVTALTGSTAAFACSDHDFGSSFGVTFDGQCFALDPRFCRPLGCALAPLAGGDYAIAADSPCRPTASPCGQLVGALDFGCAAPTPPGACCKPDGTCVLLQLEECSAPGDVYGGSGAPCSPNPCVGACCLDPGDCVVLSPLACEQAGGAYTTGGAVCSPTPCLPPGACCLPDGTCQLFLEAACAERNGAYFGDSHTCDPAACEPIGACCGPGTTCTLLTRDGCEDGGKNYLGDGTPCPPYPCTSSFNPGGVLVLHANPTLTYTSSGYCGDSGLAALSQIDLSAPVGTPVVLHIMAAFESSLNPTVSGVVFGIDYDASKLELIDWGHCGDSAHAFTDWPGPGTALDVRWNTSRTTRLFEVGWLAATASAPTELRLFRHPIEGGEFFGPPEEPTPDPIVCFGRMGFGQTGSTCPLGQLGACCLDGSHCIQLSQGQCGGAGGSYLGDGESCVPMPCATSSTPLGAGAAAQGLELLSPNPVRDELRIQLSASVGASALIRVVGASGNVVAVLQDGPLAGDRSEFNWRPAPGVPRGVYWLEAQVAGRRYSRQLLLLTR